MEAPLSRVEAILQNILGADNVLVPPQSRVEAILLAILNNTECIHPGDPSRVEEILLAIKDGGSYDKKALSRVEDILIHKLNDEEYTDYSEDDLSRVEKLLIQWIDLHPEVIKELTASSFPISILANGSPLLDYRIDGNTVQNGTPTPDSPIEPEFVGERTENLFDPENCEVGMLTVTGAVSGNYDYGKVTKDFIDVSGHSSITLFQDRMTNTGITSYFMSICSYDENYEHINRVYAYADYRGPGDHVILTKTIESNAKYIKAGICVNEPTDSPTTVHAILNLGSTALPYEPYGYKIPISSGGQTKTIYLGQVPTTRRIKKLVLTGEETINTYSPTTRYVINIPVSVAPVSGSKIGLCTHYFYDPAVFKTNGSFIIDLEPIYWYRKIPITDNRFTTADDFKSYLAQQYANNTPVTIWYVLATPEVGIVNEPLARIGDYADSIDFSQAGVEIPTLKKPNTTDIDVETEVEPSSMYLKYAEPSDGPAPKTPVLGTKDREIYVTPNNEVYVLRR